MSKIKVRSTNADSSSVSLKQKRQPRRKVAGLLLLAVIAMSACERSPLPGASPTRVPDSPAGRQLKWVLANLRDAVPIGTEDVHAHVAPDFLAQVMPADQLAPLFQQTVKERGALKLTGFAYPPRPTSIAALVGSATVHAVVYLTVQPTGAHLITGIAIQEAPPQPLAATGRYAGMFDVGGRKIFLSCVGDGSPTVVLVGGVVADWLNVQSRVRPTTRVCSYDKPNTFGSRSDSAPTPRDATGMALELDRLLAAAAVPGPFVIVGHSNGGMVAQLYALTHPRSVVGIVLVDSAHESQASAAAALIRARYPHAVAEAQVAALDSMPAPLADPEQFDVRKSRNALRSSRSSAPLPHVPMIVLVHGRADQGAPPEFAAAFEPIWLKLQQQVANAVPGSRLQVVAGAGHDIHGERPDVVAHAIIDVVTSARKS